MSNQMTEVGGKCLFLQLIIFGVSSFWIVTQTIRLSKGAWSGFWESREQYRGYPGFFSSNHKHDACAMRSTFYGEFGPGCTIFHQTTYSVHLFHVFGLGNNRLVNRAKKSYLEFWRPD